MTICTVTTTRAGWDFAVMSPYPTVANVVMVKYRASNRVRWVSKLA